MVNLFLKSYTFCSILSYTGIYCVDQEPDPYWEYGSGSTTLHLRNCESEIYGIWFYEKKDCEKVGRKVEQLVQGRRETAICRNKHLLTYLLVTVLLYILQVAWVKASYS